MSKRSLPKKSVNCGKSKKLRRKLQFSKSFNLVTKKLNYNNLTRRKLRPNKTNDHRVLPKKIELLAQKSLMLRKGTEAGLSLAKTADVEINKVPETQIHVIISESDTPAVILTHTLPRQEVTTANATRSIIVVVLTETTEMRRSAAIGGGEVHLLKAKEEVMIVNIAEMTLTMIVKTAEITKDQGIDVEWDHEYFSLD